MLVDTINEELCADLLKKTLSNGGEYADVFFEFKKPMSIILEDNKIEKILSGSDCGVGIRLIYNGKTSYAYTNELSKETLKETALSVSKAAKYKIGQETTVNLMKLRPETEFNILKRPEDVPMEIKLQRLLSANIVARNISNKIRQVRVQYADTTQHVYIANSTGAYCEDRRVYMLLLVHVIAEDSGVIQTGFETIGGFTGFELIENTDTDAIATEAAKRAVRMLKAQKINGGTMPVVISSAAGGTMIHEAIGHGLEADLAQQGVSVYANKLGQQIASSNITVIDNGTLAGKRGSYTFDDEATPSKENILVEKGVLIKYMNDRLTSLKDGAPLTGNGRRQSYQNRPIPRMTNTYLASGNDIPADILKSTDSGLFVKKMGGGQVNTLTGDFVFEVQEGFLIEKGAISVPVRGATLTGNGPQVLQSIDAIGLDLGFAIGTCGKDGQGVPVTDALPTIRIPAIVVGGVVGGN